MSSLSDALASLPHGPEFRFVNELVVLEPGKLAIGRYLLRGDEPVLAGHFPGQPMMPAVLLIEAIAQVAGLAAQSDPEFGRLADLRLAAVRNAKIHHAVVPGDTLEVSAEITGRLGNLVQAQGSVSSAGRMIAAAQITLGGN